MARFEGGTVLMSGHLEFLLNHDDEFGAKSHAGGCSRVFLQTIRSSVVAHNSASHG
jgi:hypothetical protein